jgi:hypothetical protein
MTHKPTLAEVVEEERKRLRENPYGAFTGVPEPELRESLERALHAVEILAEFAESCPTSWGGQHDLSSALAALKGEE